MSWTAEDYEQASLLEWCQMKQGQFPELSLLYHIPNEGKRAIPTAVKLNRMGLKKGVPDLCLPVARGGNHGLYIELKAAGGRASKEQKEWLSMLREQGYLAEICFGWEQAARLLERYLQGFTALDPNRLRRVSRQ